MALVTWDGGGTSTDWNEAANWTNNVLPGAADDVVIDVAASPTITFSSGSASIKSLQSTEVISLSGGTLSIAEASQIDNALNLSGGTLAGTGNLTVSGTLNWTSGTMSGSGTTIVGAGGTLNISSGNTHTLSRILQNDGTAHWTGGALQMISGTFNNNGSFTANSNSTLQSYGSGGANAFNNAGTFTKLGTGTTYFTFSSTGVPFNNTGSVDVQQGTLELDAGGLNSGAFNVPLGATLYFGNGYTHQAGSTLNNAGTTTLSSGTHSYSGTLTNTGTFNIDSSATANMLAAQSLSGTVNLAGILGGTQNATVSGTLNWTSGTMSGSGTTIVGAGGTLNISSGNTHTLSRILQ
ncbi:MAG: hypothetical protein AB7U97_02710, partial [Pirellulales bacterium]